MKTKIIFLVCVMLAVLFLGSPVSAQKMFFSGNDLIPLMGEWERLVARDVEAILDEAMQFVGYVIGVHDATCVMYGPPYNYSIGQACAVVAKFLKANPEMWHRPADRLVVEALKEAFSAK